MEFDMEKILAAFKHLALNAYGEGAQNEPRARTFAIDLSRELETYIDSRIKEAFDREFPAIETVAEPASNTVDCFKKVAEPIANWLPPVTPTQNIT